MLRGSASVRASDRRLDLIGWELGDEVRVDVPGEQVSRQEVGVARTEEVVGEMGRRGQT